MKPFPILIAVITLCAAIFTVSWLSQPSMEATTVSNDVVGHSANPLKIAESGPYPKAVLVEESHNFGSMILGETGSYTLEIRNEGDAPLKLAKGHVACKCTVPTVPKDEIPPGESAQVVMEWKPLTTTNSFDKWAVIWTNDPENEELQFTLTGQVRALIDVYPPGPWTVNVADESQPAEFNAALASGADSFNILEIETSHDWIEIEATPMTEEDLESMAASAGGDETGYGYGYMLVGKVRPEMTVGRFEAKITVHTDLNEDYKATVGVVGTRPGPFSILGQAWFGGEMTVRMGTVPPKEGKTVSLSLFTSQADEPLRIESFESSPDYATVSVKKDETFPSPTKEKYDLIFTVKPDTPSGRYLDDDRIALKVRTNRQGMEEINLSMDATVE